MKQKDEENRRGMGKKRRHATWGTKPPKISGGCHHLNQGSR